MGGLTPIKRRIIDAAVEIRGEPLERLDFQHAVLCQVGLPRKAVEAPVFERQSGNVSLLLEAGRLFKRGKWVPQGLPYGTRPRLLLMHICGEALRRKSREVPAGDSVRDFLRILGIDTSGGAKGGYTAFWKQLEALVACRLQLGMSYGGRDVTVNAQIIQRFDVWLQHDGEKRAEWPGAITLTQEFYDSLLEHAVPLDHTAVAAIKHSALALDLYTWLAHRLRRVDRATGVRVPYSALKEQFGQEYGDIRDFKKKLHIALRQVLVVYPDAKVEAVRGGLLLRASSPPIGPRPLASGLG
jgi:hypothetical protein